MSLRPKRQKTRRAKSHTKHEHRQTWRSRLFFNAREQCPKGIQGGPHLFRTAWKGIHCNVLRCNYCGKLRFKAYHRKVIIANLEARGKRELSAAERKQIHSGNWEAITKDFNEYYATLPKLKRVRKRDEDPLKHSMRMIKSQDGENFVVVKEGERLDGYVAVSKDRKVGPYDIHEMDVV